MPESSLVFQTDPTTALARERELARRLAVFFGDRGLELYLVGGAMRDALLGIASDELDFATSARPSLTAELLEEFGGHAPYRIGERFGTIGSVVEGRTIEITTFRSREVYESGSRKPSVEFGRSIEEDLSRRDFTINAIAMNPISQQIIDPFHGTDDLRRKILRAVGDPDDRFREDPLRLLRAVRFAARLELEIESATAGAIGSGAPALETISIERIRDEYSSVLTGDHPVSALTLLRDYGLFTYTVPELYELTRMPDHGPNHPLSLWEHTMRVVAAVPSELEVRWAALLHDIAKPTTRTHEPDGRTRFFHHETRGAQLALRILMGLRYPSSVAKSVSLLVETHMQLHAFSPEWSDGAVRRLCLRLAGNMDRAIALARADAAGHSDDGSSLNSPKFDRLLDRLQRLDSEQVQMMKSPLSGDDLIAHYARPPGPWIRTVKDRLLEEVLDGNLDQRDTASAWAIADRVLDNG